MSTEVMVPPLTKAQKAMPAYLLKQLRATAAVVCYDSCLAINSMSTADLQKRVYHMYHGDEDLNMVSQVDLLFRGQRHYRHLYVDYFTETPILEQDTEHRKASGSILHPSPVLHPSLSAFDSLINYSAGVHFSKAMLLASTKSKLTEKCSGRFIMDLAKATICSIKKACVVAETWLKTTDGPSGTNWDDLYHHIINNHEEIHPKERVFIGLGNFLCHTKFNDRTKNYLNSLTINDEDGVRGTPATRRGLREAAAATKSDVHDVEVGNKGLFNERGLNLDSRMQIIEMAQFEDNKELIEMNNNLTHLTNCQKLLLEERAQEIKLAMLICPKFDPEDEHWKRVNELSEELAVVKASTNEENSKKNKSTMGSTLAYILLFHIKHRELLGLT